MSIRISRSAFLLLAILFLTGLLCGATPCLAEQPLFIPPPRANMAGQAALAITTLENVGMVFMTNLAQRDAELAQAIRAGEAHHHHKGGDEGKGIGDGQIVGEVGADFLQLKAMEEQNIANALQEAVVQNMAHVNQLQQLPMAPVPPVMFIPTAH